MAETPRVNGRIDLDKPRYVQDTFTGRLYHFLGITDFRLAFKTEKTLNETKELLEKYRLGQEPPGTTEEKIWYAKKLYESAFHPDTGDLQNVIGRMSFQVPGGMVLTAGMLQFYKSNFAVISWQWMNQSFNALVNYTNRNAASSLTTKQMSIAYVSATTCALVTALGLKSYLAKTASPMMLRFVPLVAVGAANFVNIPLTRQDEIVHGVVLTDENNNAVTRSKCAANKGIGQVVFSRVMMASPGMAIMPFIMKAMEKKPWFSRYPVMHLPFQTFMVGVFLTVMVPSACSIFPQRSSIHVDRLKSSEKDRYDEIVKFYGDEDKVPERLYFNKGL